MADDLPEISQDPNAPLPDVPPDSQMVPYRMERTPPGATQPIVTTGYGPRARPPIQPPAGFGGGVGMPGLDQIYQAAFSKLPVDEAVKAVEAATRYIGLRGYQQALARGESAEKALTTYGPMILKSGTGIPEILQAQLEKQRAAQPIIREANNRLYRIPQTGQAEPISPEPPPKPVAPSFHTVGGRLYRTTPAGEATPITPEPPPKPEKPAPATEEEKDAHFEWREAIKEQNKLLNTETPSTKKGKAKLDAAQKRVDDARKKIEAFGNKSTSPFHTDVAAPAPGTVVNPAQTGETPKEVTTKAQYDELPSGTVYIGKDGKKYRKP